MIRILDYSSSTGKAIIQDCLEHIQQLQSDTIRMAKLQQQELHNGNHSDHSTPEEKEEEEEMIEELLDQDMVTINDIREVFQQLVQGKYSRREIDNND